MRKFKIGDRVVRMTDGSSIPIGHVGTVSYASECGNSIALEGIDFTYRASYFDLYEETPMTQVTKVPHKHAAVIKAWADGAKIQVRIPKAGHLDNKWEDIVEEPIHWYNNLDYRVKPEPMPDVVLYSTASNYYSYEERAYVSNAYTKSSGYCGTNPNLKLTYDGETGKLKKAEVI